MHGGVIYRKLERVKLENLLMVLNLHVKEFKSFTLLSFDHRFACECFNHGLYVFKVVSIFMHHLLLYFKILNHYFDLCTLLL